MVYLFFVIIAVMRLVQACCTKKTSSELNGSKTFFAYGAYYQGVSAALALAMILITIAIGTNPIAGLTWGVVLCSFGAALLFALELYSGLSALKSGSTIVTSNLFSNIGLIFPCVFGIFMFGEPMSLWQWFGVGLFIVSAYLLALDSKKAYGNFGVKTIIFLVLNALANGGIMILQKVYAKFVGSDASLFSFFTFLFNFLFLSVVFLVISKKQNSEIKTPVMNKKLYLYGVLLAIAVFVINLLITKLSTTVDSAILFPVSSALNIIICVLIGAIVFKEKISVLNCIGIVLGIASGVIVSIL